MLITNFRLIKAGALHRANGGYLLLNALKLLQQPFAWEALKRTLRNGHIVIESMPQVLGWSNTVPLEPEPIELSNRETVERLSGVVVSGLAPTSPGELAGAGAARLGPLLQRTTAAHRHGHLLRSRGA